MPLLAQVIPDRADDQVAAGQAKIGLHDMLGALQVRDRRARADAQQDFDVIPACRAYGQRIRLGTDPVAVNRLRGPACRSKSGIRAVRSHPDPVSIEILQEGLTVISEYD